MCVAEDNRTSIHGFLCVVSRVFWCSCEENPAFHFRSGLGLGARVTGHHRIVPKLAHFHEIRFRTVRALLLLEHLRLKRLGSLFFWRGVFSLCRVRVPLGARAHLFCTSTPVLPQGRKKINKKLISASGVMIPQKAEAKRTTAASC